MSENGENLINLLIFILQKISIIFINIKVTVKPIDEPEIIVVNKTSNLCKFFDQRSSDRMLNVISSEIDKYGSFIKTCPVEKDDLIYLNNFKINTDLLPDYLQESVIKVEFDLSRMENKTKFSFLKFIWFGEIDNSDSVSAFQQFSMSRN